MVSSHNSFCSHLNCITFAALLFFKINFDRCALFRQVRIILGKVFINKNVTGLPSRFRGNYANCSTLLKHSTYVYNYESLLDAYRASLLPMQINSLAMAKLIGSFPFQSMM